jgi:hypothetical protein
MKILLMILEKLNGKCDSFICNDILGNIQVGSLYIWIKIKHLSLSRAFGIVFFHSLNYKNILVFSSPLQI